LGLVKGSTFETDDAIDLFTDTPAILNLLELRSIMGCPCRGHSLSIYGRFLGKKENFNVFFSGKRRVLGTFIPGSLGTSFTA